MSPIRIRVVREHLMDLIEEISWLGVAQTATHRFTAAITLKMFALKIFCSVDWGMKNEQINEEVSSDHVCLLFLAYRRGSRINRR